MTDRTPKLLIDALGGRLPLRNRIVHGYETVDDEIVYLTVKDDLKDLQAALLRLLKIRG